MKRQRPPYWFKGTFAQMEQFTFEQLSQFRFMDLDSVGNSLDRNAAEIAALLGLSDAVCQICALGAPQRAWNTPKRLMPRRDLDPHWR